MSDDNYAPMPEATRRKISMALKGRPHSPEHRAKIAEASARTAAKRSEIYRLGRAAYEAGLRAPEATDGE